MPRLSLRALTRPHVILSIVGVLMLVVLVIQGLLIRQLYIRTDQFGMSDLKEVLIESIKGLDTAPAVEPTTGRLFIPSAKLVLPATSGHLYYRSGGEDSTLWFIDASNQQQAFTQIRTALTLTDVFKQVATAQACSRQVVVSFIKGPETTPTDELTLETTKTLKDGRVAYIYENKKCGYGPEALLNSLKEIQSF